MNLKEVEGIDQGDEARMLEKTKRDAIVCDKNDFLINVLNAPLGLLHQMDHEAAEHPGSSTATRKAKEKRTSW